MSTSDMSSNISNPTKTLPGQANLLSEMNINEKDIERRKEWLEFTEKDVAHLAELNGIAQGYADGTPVQA